MLRWLAPMLCLGWGAGPGFSRTLLLLPVQGEIEKVSDLAAVNDLYREAVQNAYAGSVKSPQDSAHQCGDKECAVKLAAEAKADEVIYTSLRRLGGSWIFSSSIVLADGSGAFHQRATALSLEDLEAVTRRVGEALVARKSLEQVATIDNVTAKEETQDPARRRSFYAGGFSLGYLYPMGGSYAYDEQDYLDDSYDGVSYNQMVKLTFLNTWEFRQNMILGFDLAWMVPHAVGGDLNLQYLLNRSDYTPFVGGGLGLHWARGDDDAPDDKRDTGPALNVQGGMILFRTYDIHVLARAQYHLIFNSDLDNGPSLDVGVVYQRRDRENNSGGWGSFWKYYLLGALFLSVIGSVAGD